MPRLFFTGRRKIARSDVSVVFRGGDPPEFDATLDLSRYRTLPRSGKVVVEASHNTMVQRFDFGTVADCRPRVPLRLTNFDEWDRPRFRVLVIAADREPGVLLAACERVDAVDREMAPEGGRSLLKLYPKPDLVMRGELWRLETTGNSYELWYNKDVQRIAAEIKGKQPDILGLLLPAALRQILERELFWRDAGEAEEWIQFAEHTSGEPVPSTREGEEASPEEMQTWIDNVIAAFCRNRGRFVERIGAMEEGDDESSSL